MNNIFNQNEEKKDEQEVFYEIPVITTSPPSIDTDSEASPIYNEFRKSIVRTLDSDEEIDTSFINTNNNNNTTVIRRVSLLRSLSPGNLNASGVSRGVIFFFLIFSFFQIKIYGK